MTTNEPNQEDIWTKEKERFSVDLDILISKDNSKNKNQGFEASVRNLSLQGAWIQASTRFKILVDDAVSFTIYDASDLEFKISGRAKVKWLNASTGRDRLVNIGIEFTEIDQDSQKKLQGIIDFSGPDILVSA